jgi:hypothetical protein
MRKVSVAKRLRFQNFWCITAPLRRSAVIPVKKRPNEALLDVRSCAANGIPPFYSMPHGRHCCRYFSCLKLNNGSSINVMPANLFLAQSFAERTKNQQVVLNFDVVCYINKIID